MKRTPKAVPVIADICLYGNDETGAGYLGQVNGGDRFGDGEPRPYWSKTEAVWLALGEMRLQTENKRGAVRIFAPGGKFMAVVDANKVGYYGDLPWEAAVQYAIDVEALVGK